MMQVIEDVLDRNLPSVRVGIDGRASRSRKLQLARSLARQKACGALSF